MSKTARKDIDVIKIRTKAHIDCTVSINDSLEGIRDDLTRLQTEMKNVVSMKILKERKGKYCNE